MTTSIQDTLKSINVKEDKDIAFIFAASINLYIESLRRLRGRIMVGPNDIQHLLNIVHTLVQLTPEKSSFQDNTLRPRELTPNETSSLLGALNEEVNEARRA